MTTHDPDQISKAMDGDNSSERHYQILHSLVATDVYRYGKEDGPEKVFKPDIGKLKDEKAKKITSEFKPIDLPDEKGLKGDTEEKRQEEMKEKIKHLEQEAKRKLEQDLKQGEKEVEDEVAAKKASLFEKMIQELGNAGGDAKKDTVSFLVTFLYDRLREDSSVFDIIQDKKPETVTSARKILEKIVKEVGADSFVANRAAWVLSAMIGHLPQCWLTGNPKDAASKRAEDVVKFTKDLLDGESASGRSELGTLEALTNMMKAQCFRAEVLNTPGVEEKLFKIDAGNINSPTIYRRVFAMWLVSFDSDLSSRNSEASVEKIKLVLTMSRVEKVIRLALTVLTNFLSQNNEALRGHIVEFGVLDVVQQLEYEKWRDPDLYKEISDVAGKISLEVSEQSKFTRYAKELKSRELRWGFIHSSKFWQENVLKFEAENFKAIKDLANLLNPMTDGKDGGRNDYETTAVACHDIGEFVSLHPQGKKKIAEFMVTDAEGKPVCSVKERVMELMAKTDHNYREVRREALLCCQKIMLNKWQDVKSPDASK